MYLCEKCGKKVAVIHYTEKVNGVVHEWDLCADCAAKEDAYDVFETSFGLFPSLFAKGKAREEKICPVCKTAFSTVSRKGKFGCAACYDAFAPYLDMTPFVGKGYEGEKVGAEKKQETKTEAKEEKPSVETLRRLLAQAVKEERYEEAATLRDRIREEEK